MKKILFVDSSESLLDLYYEEFSEEGYEVILALDGQRETLQEHGAVYT